MAWATGLGSWPGTSYHRALDEVEGVLGRVPFLPELPGRGPAAGMIGRTLGLLHGGEAGELLEADVEAWLPRAGDGPVTIAVTGPWTLSRCAAFAPGTVARLEHEVARRAAALVARVEEVLPGPVTLQLDEPMLSARPEAVDLVHRCVEALDEGSHCADPDQPRIVVHCCATPAPVDALVRLGIHAAVDATTLARLPPGWRAGIVPTSGHHDAVRIAEDLRRKVAPEELGALVVTPTCGLGVSQDAEQRLRTCVEVARLLEETS